MMWPQQLLPDGSQKQQTTASLREEQTFFFQSNISARRTFPSNATNNQPIPFQIAFLGKTHKEGQFKLKIVCAAPRGLLLTLGATCECAGRRSILRWTKRKALHELRSEARGEESLHEQSN